MRRYSGFEHERVLLYHSRMQHIVGHCDPTPEIKSTRQSQDPLSALDGQKPKPPVWTLCSPKYKFKRAASLVAAQQRQRPSSAPAKRTSAFGTLVQASSPARRPGLQMADVVQHAQLRKEQRKEQMARQFAQAVSKKSVHAVAKRLAFAQVQKIERQKAFTHKFVQKQHQKMEANRPPQWVRKFQCGVWFWVDENTGEARQAPPPEVRDDDASSVGLCKKWHAEERHRQTTRRRVRKYFDDETIAGLDDDASVDSTIPLGTGYVAYEPSPYEELCALLDQGKLPRPKSAPAGGRRPAAATATATKARGESLTKARSESRTKARSESRTKARGESRTVLGVTPRRQRLLENAAATGRLSPSR